MDIQLERAVNRALDQQMAILEQVIREGNEESVLMAAIRLAFIGTAASAEMLLRLTSETTGDIRRQDAIAGAFLRLSPYRDTHKQQLLDLFPPDEQQDAIQQAYADTDKLDPRLLALVPLHEAIAEAYHWNFDDSGD